MFSQIRSCSGKERTAEISDKAQRLGLKAEAVEYCITYREDGVCGGEAFCLLIMSNYGWLKNIDAVNIGRIRLGLPRLSHYYWSVEEQDDRQAHICNYGLSEVIAYNKCNRAKVLPVTVLKIADTYC